MGKTFGRTKVKSGMKGSSAGRERSGSTAELKHYSKTARRQAKYLARELDA